MLISRKFYPIIFCGILAILGSPLVSAADYQYTIEDDWISLSDGTRLAVTYYKPVDDEVVGAKFPVLLEMLPYRKDDISRSSSHPNYDYFARQGLGMARVDIRGTGSSEGQTPSREYSDREIEDAIEVIAALAELPWSNGKVGMWGISWGGFNAIQVAMRNPPHLTAILAAHASDDLYKNDVHYNDGIFNIDEYVLSINHLNGFMQSPDYAIDEEYFQQRFDREPWLFEVMRQNKDGEFWRDGSLRWHYDQLKIPVYLIGGLLDGYRDTLPRALENLDTPVRAILGPWPHAWPSAVTPGPSWEWRADASNWWRYWLLDDDSENNNFDGQEFRVFLRDGGDVPDSDRETITGKWLALDWPVPMQDIETMNLYPSTSRLLSRSVSDTNRVDTLSVIPGAGVELGEWWGEQLGDMSAVDQNSLNYDSAVLDEEIILLGNPSVTLLAAADSKHANWIVRLEDIHPSGQVSLITGGAINGAQRESSLQPSELSPNEFVMLDVPLHFTTWTFKPGHRIRLAVSNSAFPMYWPSAGANSTLRVDNENSVISLPILKTIPESLNVSMPEADASNSLSSEIVSFAGIEGRPSRSEVIEDANDNSLRFVRESAVAYRIQHPVDSDKTIILESERYTQHTTNNTDGADSGFEAWAEYRLLPAQGRNSTIRYRTTIDLQSDADSFELEIVRTLSDGNGEVRSKRWRERFSREHQ
jgi:putative CocE/NonD family hydrolase